jgi:dolichol kinase
MESPLIALALPPLLIVPAMGMLSRIRVASPLQSELRRKTLHILTGLLALGLPFVLRQPVAVLGALAAVAAWMLAVRLVPSLRERFGCVLHAAGRQSYGELYFAVALASLLLVCEPGSILYSLPVLILTLADSAAAVVGRAWPWRPYRVFGGRKSLGGSLAFVTCAAVVAVAMLGFATDMAFGRVLCVALLVAVLTGLTEALSPSGSDNLSIPATTWLTLHYLLNGV